MPAFTENPGFWEQPLSRDAKILVTGSWDATASMWEAASRKKAQDFECDARVTCVALSEDNKYVATAGVDRKASLWECGQRKEEF